VAWVLFIIILLITMLVFKSSRRWVYYEGDN
jgi:multiple sugar transport system permease protein